MRTAENWPDRLIGTLDRALRTVAAPQRPARPSPATGVAGGPMKDVERRRSIELMRVNHAGEIAAQALYHGQALVARSGSTRRRLEKAAGEERDHLAWCAERLCELGGRPSTLDPLWYAGSFCVGVLAGRFGDPISMGFVAETEKQVEAHLADHLQRLPAADVKSRAVLAKMSDDEIAHGAMAVAHGARDLPPLARRAMSAGGELLRRTASFL